MKCLEIAILAVGNGTIDDFEQNRHIMTATLQEDSSGLSLVHRVDEVGRDQTQQIPLGVIPEK